MAERSRLLESVQDRLPDLSEPELLEIRKSLDLILSERLLVKARAFLQRVAGARYGKISVFIGGVQVRGGVVFMNCLWLRTVEADREKQVGFDRLIAGMGGRITHAYPPQALSSLSDLDGIDVSVIRPTDYVCISVPVEKFLS